MGNQSCRGKAAQNTEFERLLGIVLEDLETHRVFKSDELWEDPSRVTIVHVIRRPGCQLCREQAQLLSSIVSSLPGVQLIGVVHEKKYIEDIVEFRKEYFGSNPVYYDEDRGFNKAQGNRYQSYIALLSPSVISAVNRTNSKGIKGNTRGEGHYLGGVLVVRKGRIIFEHREEYFGDNVSAVREIVTAATAPFSTKSKKAKSAASNEKEIPESEEKLMKEVSSFHQEQESKQAPALQPTNYAPQGETIKNVSMSKASEKNQYTTSEPKKYAISGDSKHNADTEDKLLGPNHDYRAMAPSTDDDTFKEALKATNKGEPVRDESDGSDYFVKMTSDFCSGIDSAVRLLFIPSPAEPPDQ